MDTKKAFMMGDLNRHKEMMVFDWVKAAQIIKERKPQTAMAGLRGDWEWTGGTIYHEGKIVTDNYTYLSSTWAVPELDIDGKIISCFIMESDTEWESDTKWPPEAIEILNDWSE